MDKIAAIEEALSKIDDYTDVVIKLDEGELAIHFRRQIKHEEFDTVMVTPSGVNYTIDSNKIPHYLKPMLKDAETLHAALYG